VNSAWDSEFEAVIRSVLPDLSPLEPLRPETDLSLIGLDSMRTVELLISLEDQYSVTFPDEALQQTTFSTPAALWATISTLSSDSGTG
jgi:acyl carrier protein